jgi:hypothetical protein
MENGVFFYSGQRDKNARSIKAIKKKSGLMHHAFSNRLKQAETILRHIKLKRVCQAILPYG